MMRLLLRLLALLALLELAACSMSFVGGGGAGIPPSQFQFQSVITAEGQGAGGWKVARVIISLTRLSETEVKYVPCQVQVEVPEVNFRGAATTEAAQRAAASAADRAVERVLPRQDLLSAELCAHLRMEMLKHLKRVVPGVRIRSFITFWTSVPNNKDVPVLVWSIP